MQEFKTVLRPLFKKLYKHDLLNHLFSQPYTKIDFMCEAMQVEQRTAAKYLDMIVEAGLLEKVKHGRTNYYINSKLVALLIKPEQ